MAICRILRLNGRSGKLRALISAAGRVASHKTKTRRVLSSLTSVVLLGSIAEFNETPANAQASLPNDYASMARTTNAVGGPTPGQL